MIEKLSLVTTEKIIEIKNLNLKSETTDLDYKEMFKISDTKSKVEFIKDVCAFANSKGGYLIFGVNNNADWIGLDEKSDDKIDDADINNIIDDYVDGNIDFISNIIEIEDSTFFVMYIEESKDILPFKKDGQFNKKIWGKNSKEINTTVFKKGDVYCRRGSRSIKADNLFFKKKKNNFKIIENVLIQNNLYNEFIGREEHIQEIFLKLNNDNNRIIQIDGIGGIGKTSFVHYFCKQLINNELFNNDFEFIIWTSSKRNKYTPKGIRELTDFISNYSDLINDIYKFIEEFNLENEEDTSDVEQIVKTFLSNNKVLLIVDNLETLNDSDLITFLENFPKKSKAVLTTRETLGDFFMARINLSGFQEINEFPNFLNSQFKIFTSKDVLFTDMYFANLKELYTYTKGMPLAGQLITHQIANSTPIENVLENLKSGDAYHDILTFCFQGSIDKLSEPEKKVLYILSLSEREELLTADDICYITELNNDEIGFSVLPKLSSISLCFSQMTDSEEIGYTIPHLAKIYSKKFINLNNEKQIIDRFETFTQEKRAFSNGDLNSLQLQYRSNATNHKEKVASIEAIKTFSISNIDYDFAIEKIDELIKQNNKFPFLYLIKGKIQDNSFHPNSYELAKKDFLIAIDLDKDFLESLIELGYLELKNRVGKNKTSKEMINEAISYFDRVVNLENDNQRAHLGLAQAYSAQSKDISYFNNKELKQTKAKKANEHYEKSYYDSEKITPTQKHSNAISSFSHALNYNRNLKDYEKAFECCEKGLSFEPKNTKLIQLKEELNYKINPTNYSVEKFKDKGWIRK